MWFNYRIGTSFFLVLKMRTYTNADIVPVFTPNLFYKQRSFLLTSLIFQIFTSRCLCCLLSFQKLTSIVAYFRCFKNQINESKFSFEIPKHSYAQPRKRMNDLFKWFQQFLNQEQGLLFLFIFQIWSSKLNIQIWLCFLAVLRHLKWKFWLIYLIFKTT